MHLTTAHKILIGSAIVFFGGYSLWELNRFATAGAPSSLVAGVISGAGAAGLALYLRRFVRSLGKQ